jgi:ADP-ribose pyrophosphatase YjhB (NUDIX family)
MAHRISAGAIVEHDGRLLLVHHRRPGAWDFWVAPGGGVQGTESLEEAAVREVREETGLQVAVTRLAYIEELHSPMQRHVKFWFAATLAGSHADRLDTRHPDTVAEGIVEAAWVAHDALAGLTLFPTVLTLRWRTDRDAGFPAPVRLPLRAMTFW